MEQNKMEWKTAGEYFKNINGNFKELNGMN